MSDCPGPFYQPLAGILPPTVIIACLAFLCAGMIGAALNTDKLENALPEQYAENQ
jgi:hypothetical protein